MAQPTMDELRVLRDSLAAARGRIAPGKPARGEIDRRRTERSHALLALGIHPATERPLLVPPGPSCAGCAHLVVRQRSKRYYKCERHRLGPSRSEASDVRISWPACELFEAAAS